MIDGLVQQFSSECGQRLPRLLFAPLALIPGYLHSSFLAGVLNRIVADLNISGELDYLEKRVVCLRLEDVSITFGLQFNDGRFKAWREKKIADVIISSSIYDFLILAARQEDADTLFFQRRLKLEGDTELGLALKNQLDAMDWESLSLPSPLRKAAKKGASLISAFRRMGD